MIATSELTNSKQTFQCLRCGHQRNAALRRVSVGQTGLAIDDRSMFDAVLDYRNGRWEWRVCDRQGNTILHGFESTHAQAKHQSECSLFFLERVANPTKRSGGGN